MTDNRLDGPTARADWEARIGKQTEATAAVPMPSLAAPSDLRAAAGRGQVTLDWQPVDGAVGYIVQRSTTVDGPYQAVEVGEPLVRAVPHPPFTDTTGEPGKQSWYRVSPIAAIGDESQPASRAVAATPLTSGDGRCTVTIDVATTLGPLHRPWQPMIGAEHLSQLDYDVGPGGRHIGDEFAAALRMAHDDLGVRAVRAHAILDDELGTYREVDGKPVHDFSGIDRIYDRILDFGLRPIVEISFMPRDLARDPAKTVFEYGAIVSPPRDWDRWAELVRALTAHLVERYGLGEVRSWGFEVWNEANLDVFWSGTPAEYLRLYDVTARAVKAVDRSLRVGGPASAAVGWLDLLLDHVRETGTPIDFLSTHTYGNAPLDLRPLVARHGFPDLPLWWTEWGAHASHFNHAHDSVWSGAYLVRGMVSAMGRIEALAYWTISDHFEELGRPSSLLHGGFGLLGLGNLRKPRWWGLWMLEQLGAERVAADLSGDGAGDMVDAVAARDGDGRVTAVVWNGTVDVGKSTGEALLDRRIDMTVNGLGESGYLVRHSRLDAEHSNINRVWQQMGDDKLWPTESDWPALRAADQLDVVEPEVRVHAEAGTIQLAFDLPMPGVSLIELVPVAE